MTRREILRSAEKCVCGDREEDYGRPENNFNTIAEFWNTYLSAKNRKKNNGNSEIDSTKLDGHDVAIMMCLLKIARIAGGHYNADNYIDLTGYCICGGEIISDKKDSAV